MVGISSRQISVFFLTLVSVFHNAPRIPIEAFNFLLFVVISCENIIVPFSRSLSFSLSLSLSIYLHSFRILSLPAFFFCTFLFWRVKGNLIDRKCIFTNALTTQFHNFGGYHCKINYDIYSHGNAEFSPIELSLFQSQFT